MGIQTQWVHTPSATGRDAGTPHALGLTLSSDVTGVRRAYFKEC